VSAGAPLGPKRLRLTAAAERDLEGILRHLAEVAGLEVALREAGRLDAGLSRLAALGHSGVSREWLRPRLRMHVMGDHCVYFRTEQADMLVLRVLHGRMDLAGLRFEG
jgi:toxin ParE1/3/4